MGPCINIKGSEGIYIDVYREDIYIYVNVYKEEIYYIRWAKGQLFDALLLDCVRLHLVPVKL